MTSTAPEDVSVLSRDAILYTLPLFDMARARAAMCPRRDDGGQFAGDSPDSTLAWLNQMVRGRQLLGPKNRQIVSPNNDTLYVSAWLDVGDEPLLLSAPDTGGRYYVLGLLDCYTNPFESLGTRTTGNGAQRFLLHHQDMTPPVVEGATPIACPTRDVWLIGRILVDGQHDLAEVHELQNRFTVTTLTGEPAQRRFDVGMSRSSSTDDARHYATVVNAALMRNPPPDRERNEIEKFAAIGIGPGIDASALEPSVVDELEAALAQVRDELAEPQPSALGGGWFLPVDVRASFGDDYLKRAHVSQNYIGALGIDEAMYLTADRDSEGRPLDGRHTYALTFPAQGLPQAGAFWSITMYDKGSCMLMDNVIHRYSIGDRSTQLHYDEQGLTLQFSAQPPLDPVAHDNWLPAPNGQFYILLRIYIPGEAHLERSFRYPALRRVGT